MKAANNHNEELPKAERIAYLIAGFLQNTLTPEEMDELDNWVVASDENLRLFEDLTDEETLASGIQWYQQLDQQKALQNVKAKLGVTHKPRRFLQTAWPYMVAATLVIVVALFLLLRNTTSQQSPPVAKTPEKEEPRTGRNQAVLTLASGRTIILDQSGIGVLAVEKGVQVQKKPGGELQYNGTAAETALQTLSIPRGGQYKVTLSDGSQVWLNAESTLRFPASFTGEKRAVTLIGEAYFEVAKNPRQPFEVILEKDQQPKAVITVLGTHFNINGYGDEGVMTTTLLEGSVQVSANRKAVVLQPGQQALINQTLTVSPADTQEAVTWKKGTFLFRDASVKTIGAALARWYDVDVEYRDTNPYHLNATIDRSEPLHTVISVLESTRRVHFKQQGTKLIIEP